MTINLKFDGTEGNFDTDTCEMVCVPHWKYREVELCIKTDDGVNVPIGEIKLYLTDKWVDADATFEDAKKFGNEIVKRWNDGLVKESHEGLKAKHLPTGKVVWVKDNPEFDAYQWIDEDSGEGYYKEEIVLI